jgi:glyoxylase I family protein
LRGTIHHIDLTVTDPKASFPLYDAVLTALGYRLEDTHERGFDWNHATHPPLSIGIVAARAAAPAHDRYAPGLHHLAWAVDSRAAVDEMHQLLVSIGADILDAPAEYSRYNRGRGYYAVFFADRDGLKLEIAYTPPPA